MKVTPKKKLTALLLLAPFFLLASLSVACGHEMDGVEVTYIIGSMDRYVTGYVYDDYSGHPICDARVLVENDWDNIVYEGYSDWDGYFEVYIGDFYDYEDIFFRAWRISAPGYETYVADNSWYGVSGDWEIYTGEYYLYRR